VPLFGRRAALAPLPLVLPRLGDNWPVAATRPSFEASTYYETGCRQAYEPAAHALAGLLLGAALPHLPTGAAEVDAPYMHKVLLTAARIGAGIGLVERTSTAARPGELDPAVAGALGLARRQLPAMQEPAALAAAWCLLAGHYLARHEPSQAEGVLRELVEQLAGAA